MIKKSFSCNNFSGINRSLAIFNSNLITASNMQNVELFATRINSGVGIRVMKGNISVCDLIPEDERVINIFQSVQKNQNYFFVHTENSINGKIYLFHENSKTLNLKVDNLSVTGKSSACDFAQGWSDLFVFSNSEELLTIEIGKYNENNELAEVEILNLLDGEGRNVKGLGIVNFAGRLWVFSSNILWYSVQEDIKDFSTSDATISTSAGFIEFVKNITAVYPYLGSLAVFHNNSSCLIAHDKELLFYKTMDFPGGCASYNSLCFHGTELFFYDDTKKGIFCFKQIVNGDKTLGDNIAYNIQEELFSISKFDLDKIKTLSVVTEEKNEVWFLLPSQDENYSIILIYDYLRQAWIKRKSQKINCFNIIDNKLYSAGKKIYLEYMSEYFDNEFISAFYECTPLNLGYENSVKILSSLPKISVDTNYNNDFYVKYIKNYDEKTTKIRKITTKNLYNILYFDLGFWDKNYFANKFINTIKKIPISFFKTLQITFFTKVKGESFCIKNIEMEKIKIKTIQ